jgi:hypothetical protein
MAFIPADYEPVDSRIHRFWSEHPDGRIHTEIVLINETEIVIKASIYADRDDTRPVSIDFAQETRNSTPVNKLSFVENCATSAIGRALATYAYSPKGKRPSKEEMEKVQRGEMRNDRDWEKELDTLTTDRNLVGLRALRKDAVKSLQPMELIVKIDAAGKLISDTP